MEGGIQLPMSKGAFANAYALLTGSREGGRTALLSPTQRYECTRAFGCVHG